MARFRVLLVPDWVQWITGTIARSVVRFNPWIDATIVSGSVLNQLMPQVPRFFDNFDLVHFTCSYSAKKWLPMLREHIPCVTTHHHVSDWDLMKHNADGDVVVVASHQWADDLTRRGVPSARIVRLPYGVDSEQFSPASPSKRRQIRRHLRVRDETVVIGFFAKRSSNEYDRKGIDIFTKAIVELRRDLDDITVIIVGPGWDDFASSVRRVGLRCIYFPFLSRNTDLVGLYHALDFYWITSRIEGGPVPLLEAMSSEVCCITTPVGIARDIVRDSYNGALIAMNDWKGFAARTGTLARDSVTRTAIAREGRKTILQTMDLAILYPAIADVYAIAAANFSERTGKSFETTIPTALPLRMRPGPIQNIPLNGIPRSLHRYVRILENLSWAEELMNHGQRRQAYSLLVQQCLRQPQSGLGWRALARHILPAPIVSKLARLKNADASSH